MRIHRLLSLLPLALCHEATALESGKHCFGACELTLNYVTFKDTDPDISFKIRRCQSVLRTTSLYLCFVEYCTQNGRNQWLQKENSTCQRLVNLTMPPFDIVSRYTPEDIANVTRLSSDEGLRGAILNDVVIPAKLFFDRAFRTLVAAYFEVDIHVTYGIAMYFFWAIVIAIGLSTRLIALIRSVKSHGWMPIPEDGHTSSQSLKAGPQSPSMLLKRYLIVPAAFGYHCSQNLGWCTIPPRIQSLTIASFVALNITLCSVSYPVVRGNLYWPNTSDQLWRYVSDRTGVISLMNFPLVWLFGTRNNVLLWLTGWGFGTYNNFHRWVGRVSAAQAVVHSVGYTVMITQSGGWNHLWKYFHKHYFWNGELATIGMCTILLLSVYGLRRSHYEIFLAAHIALSVLVLITMLYHVEIFTNGEWNGFIYISALFWVFDRLLRILRILAFNWKFWDTQCQATYNNGTNLLRLEIPCPQRILRTNPGSYYYLYVLDDILFAHQNHPFTVAYVKSSKPRPGRLLQRRTPFSRASSHSSTESDSLLEVSSTNLEPVLVFLIRPYDGFTLRLKELTSSTAGAKPLRALVEGPYGDTFPLHDFPRILFVVGGTGIAVALSHLNRLLAEDSQACDIHIIWAVRSHLMLADILQHDFRGLVNDERISLTAHITQEDELNDDLIHELDHGVRIQMGRPDIEIVVGDAARQAGCGKLAVVACGPGAMADDTRRAAVCALGHGHCGVEYFEESFKW